MDFLTFFNGNVLQQIENGTYHLCRDWYTHHLDQKVSNNLLSQAEATRRLKIADDLWAAKEPKKVVKEIPKSEPKVESKVTKKHK